MIGQTGLRRDLCARRVELAAAQRVKQLAYEDDALPLPAGKTFADEKFETDLHGLAYLAAEPAVGERCRPAREKLPVEPVAPFAFTCASTVKSERTARASRGLPFESS